MERGFQSRVLIMPSDLAESELPLKVLKLKHPRTGTQMSCLLGPNGTLCEIVSFSERHSSWIIGNTIVKDGRMHMVTAVDPLFLILPYLQKGERFCPIDDVLVDEEFPDSKYLSECCTHKSLQHVAKFKEAMGQMVYCYDESRILDWLKKKVDQAKEVLQNKEISVEDGSQAANYNPGKHDCSSDEYVHLACRLISEYIAVDLAEKLCNLYGFSLHAEDEESEETTAHQQKQKTKSAEEVVPLEDYSSCPSTPELQKSKTKLTASQKRLQKSDKTGMKNISSFFQKK